MNQTRIKKPPLGISVVDTSEDSTTISYRPPRLTQHDIDNVPPPDPCFPARPHPVLGWLNDVPGGLSTILVLVAFALGCWGVWLIAKIVEAK